VIRNNLPHAHDTPQMLPHECLSRNLCGSRPPQLPQHFSLNSADAGSTAVPHCRPTVSVYIFLTIRERTEALRQKRGNRCGTVNTTCLTNRSRAEDAEATAEASHAATGGLR